MTPRDSACQSPFATFQENDEWLARNSKAVARMTRAGRGLRQGAILWARFVLNALRTIGAILLRLRALWPKEPKIRKRDNIIWVSRRLTSVRVGIEESRFSHWANGATEGCFRGALGRSAWASSLLAFSPLLWVQVMAAAKSMGWSGTGNETTVVVASRMGSGSFSDSQPVQGPAADRRTG